MFLTEVDHVGAMGLPAASLQWNDWQPRDTHFGGPQSVVIRIIDITIATLALVFMLPLLIVVCFLVQISDGGPAIFYQDRIGLNGNTFRCMKFRSMVVDANLRLAELLANDPEARAEWQCGQKLRYDPRITLFGRFLRKSSIDELPQLVNVLRGDMSIVGPRPIIHDEAHRYGRYLRDYVKVKPGLTGLWQVCGRNAVSYRRRVALDVIYVRNRSLWLNSVIVLRTVPTVLFARGCS